MSSEFMLNQSLASDSHGNFDEKWGSLKADLPYCQTMTFKILSHALFQFYFCQIRLSNVQAFPSISPCQRIWAKNSKAKFWVVPELIDHHLCQEHSSGRQVLSLVGRTLYPAHAVEHSITPLPPASGAKGTQASYICQRHRSVQVFLVVARK